ncbi:MAG: ribbon-helix-helix domain-containing protein [Pseudomonadota bacterium]
MGGGEEIPPVADDNAALAKLVGAAGRSGRPIKRSVMIAGHRTSVSLEARFWDGLACCAAHHGLTVPELIARLDAARSGDAGLSSTLRAAVLLHVQDASAIER